MCFKIFILFIICLSEVDLITGGYYGSIDNNTYFISHPFKMNWYQANRYCTYHGMHLIDINTEEENNRILSIIKRYAAPNNITDLHLWTSGTDLGTQRQFYWTTTGHAIIYTNWLPNRPDTATHNCLVLHGSHQHRWNDQPCLTTYWFMCRDSLSLPDTLNGKCVNNKIDVRSGFGL